MSIETYTSGIGCLYIVLFLAAVFMAVVMGIVEIWCIIRKKPLRYWRGIIPCFIFYLVSAILSTFVASMAYDDIADPNYVRYGNWTLQDFILHDIRTFIIWLVIGVLLYRRYRRRSFKDSQDEIDKE